MTAPKWSKDELDKLIHLLGQNLSDTQIAERLQRSQSSITAKVSRLQKAGLGRWRKRGRTLTLWTQDDEDTASRMWREGSSASSISKALDGRHSRNAVIGKMYRLGVDTPVQQPVALKPKNPRPKRVAKPAPLTVDEKIIRLHKNGIKTSDIACRQKVRKSVVVDILLKAGMDVAANDPRHYSVDPMWSMNEDDRRMAFYTKFQSGWAEVLKRLAKPHA